MNSINHMQFSNVVWHTQRDQSVRLKELTWSPHRRGNPMVPEKIRLWYLCYPLLLPFNFIVCAGWKANRERRHLGRCIQNYSIHSFGLSLFINSLRFAYKQKTHTEYCIIDWKQCQHHWPLCRCNTIHTQCTPVNDVQ